jgi:general secretion pathway protein B
VSFILDALRKSENARQRQGGPALADVPMGRRRENRPWWVWAIAALLGINLVVLLVVLVSGRDPAPVAPDATPPVAASVPATSAAPVAPAPAPAVARPQPAPIVEEAVDAEPASGPSLAEEAAVSQASSIDRGAPIQAAAVPDRTPMVRPLNPGAAQIPTPASTEESLPTVNELTGDRAAGIPPLHLDIHVFSTNPGERFVFINNRKYVEGATLTEGPVLERIRTDGVVLNQRGFRFVLPRQ